MADEYIFEIVFEKSEIYEYRAFCKNFEGNASNTKTE
jgi:hypothetical protein